MTSKPVAFLLADLGVTQSHSRPHVANDNPFSEAQFKTLKYRGSPDSSVGHFRFGRVGLWPPRLSRARAMSAWGDLNP